jgi:hypothetical protein
VDAVCFAIAVLIKRTVSAMIEGSITKETGLESAVHVARHRVPDAVPWPRKLITQRPENLLDLLSRCAKNATMRNTGSVIVELSFSMYSSPSLGRLRDGR